MKNILLRVVMILMSLLVGLLIMEGALRMVPSLLSVPLLAHFPAPLRHHIADRLNYGSVNDYAVVASDERVDRGPPIYHPAPDSTFISVRDPADLKEGAIEVTKMDPKGFCNPTGKAERPNVDIVVLGDSFVACTGVEAADASTQYLEELSKLSTYNMGVAGVGPYEYVELLRKYGLDFKPRVVILNFYEGNDLRDAVRYEAFLKSGRDRRNSDEAFERLLSNSYAISFIYAAREWFLRDQIKWLFDKDRDVNYRYTARSQGAVVPLNVTNQDRGEVRDATRLINGEISLDLWTPPLVAFKELAASKGFVGIVSYTPSMHTAYAHSAVFEDEKTGKAVRAMSTMQRDWLAKKTAELGLIYIDLTPAFQKAADEGPLTHFPANVHLTPYGHRVSATEWTALIARTPGLATTTTAQ
ncbi:MAG: hypothetical protein ACOZAM_21170 [Pseudomonadota bacterium]